MNDFMGYLMQLADPPLTPPGGNTQFPGIQDTLYGRENPSTWRVDQWEGIEPPDPLSEWRRARGNIRGTIGYGQDVADYFRANNNLTMTNLFGGSNSPVYRFGQGFINPPVHALGWPYPGFNSDLHESLGIPQSTPLGVLPNSLIYGHEHPETTIAGQISQGAPEFLDWLRNNNPMGWGR